jgi:hypothetical protein
MMCWVWEGRGLQRKEKNNDALRVLKCPKTDVRREDIVGQTLHDVMSFWFNMALTPNLISCVVYKNKGLDNTR